MKQFFKFALASLTGTLFALLIIFFVLTGVVASLASLAERKPVIIEEGSVLQIKLDKPIPERTPASPFSQIGFSSSGGFDLTSVIGLNDIISMIKRAKEDDKIKGIYLDLSIIPAPLATLEAIRNELKEFKASEKFIIAYSDIFSQKALYMASVADEIYLNPVGTADFRGLSMHVMFFKGLLEKVDVDMQVVRYGEYKSAVEPFLDNKMSEANKEQSLKYISGIWQHMIEQIARERTISAGQLNIIADSILLQQPEDAKNYGLVDDLLYMDEFYNRLRELLEMEEDDTPAFVTLEKYNKVAGSKKKIIKNKKPEVAVIYAIGEIVTGEGDDNVIGSDKISTEIRKARKDTTIKAIVLRINSPGGSALASDVIWREMVLAREEKPVVVSMGHMAASGGYYIACPANKIFAQPNTLTGSIGVFGVIPNMQGLLNNKLGITIDGVQTNKHADFGYPYRALSTYEYDVLQNIVDNFYMTFVDKVASGRDMTVEQVKEIGSGRIWSGLDAVNIGLVDELGGLDTAISYAANLANIDEYTVGEYPAMKPPLQDLLEKLGMNMRTRSIQSELGEAYPFFMYMKNIHNMEPVQARLPFELYVR